MSPRAVRLQWPERPTHAPAALPRDLTALLRLPGAASGATARLLAGDALAVADRLLQDGQAGTFDLVHLDPPFGSEADYSRKRGLEVAGQPPLELTLAAYGDSDGGDLAGYLDALHPVLCRYHQLLAPHGSLYLHLDHRRGPYARLLLDEIFGADHLINQIIWAYGLGGSSRRRFQRKHDVIYFYARDPRRLSFAAPQEAATSSMLAGQPKLATDTWVTPDRHDEAGIERDWPDELVSKTLSNRDPERTGYPTQKPLALALRMVSASVPPGGKVLDLMSGSGTVGVAAALLGRHAVLGDRSAVALDVARGRLVGAGARVEVSSVDGEAGWRALPGGASVQIEAQPAGRSRVTLGALRLPWSDRDVHAPAEVRARLGELAHTDGAELLSAWGLAQRDPDGALRSVASWDGGARRNRELVPRSLSPAVADTQSAPLWWWGVDVRGHMWRCPL